MKRGFSLLEVILAIALIALLSGSVVAFALRLAERRAALLEHSRRLVGADAVIDSIEADLLTCLAGDARRGAGVKGDQRSLRILSRAVQLGSQRSAQRMRTDDLRSTEYRFDDAGRALTAARASVLFAKEAGGAREPVLEEVGRVRFRYHDGNAWRDAFDSSAAGALPRAVEVAIWFSPPAPEAGPPDVASEESAESEAGDDVAYLEDLSIPEAPADEPLPDVDLPPPDRLRIIAVPDAGDAAAGDRAARAGGEP